MGYDCTLSDGVTTLGIKLYATKQAGAALGLGTSYTTQDITPSEAQFRNSEPGFGDSSPYSLRAYASSAGSIGKLNEVQAPGDTSRPFLSDLNSARPGQLGVHLAYPGDFASIGLSSGGTIFTQAPYVSLTAPAGNGFIAQAADGLYIWRWDVPTHSFKAWNRVLGTPVNFTVCQSFVNTVRCAASRPRPTVMDAGGHWWYPLASGGMVDIAQPYGLQVAADAGNLYWYAVSMGDKLFTFMQADPSGTAPGCTVTVRTYDTFSLVRPDPELSGDTRAIIQQQIPQMTCMFPPVVLEGAIYFCDDKALYKLVYDENNCRVLIAQVKGDFPVITAPPCVFNGDVYVPTANMFWRWTPGQRVPVAMPVDGFGCMPPPWNGNIVSTFATATAMYFAVSDSTTSVQGTALLRLDTQGVLTTQHFCVPGEALLVSPMISFVDTGPSNPSPVIGILDYPIAPGQPGFNAANLRIIPLYDAARDPAYLPPAQRPQRAGSHFQITPWDPAVNYADRKNELRIAADCADVSNAYFIRIWYQLDYQDRLADALPGFSGVIANTVMHGQGAWTPGLLLNAATPGLTADGGVAGGYADISLTPGFPAYRRVRYAIEIVGDPTGVTYPRLIGFTNRYSETPLKYYLTTLKVHVKAAHPEFPTDPLLSPDPSAPTDPAGVYAVYATYLNWSKTGAILTFTDINGDVRPVKITKLQATARSAQPIAKRLPYPQPGERRVDEWLLTLSVQDQEAA